MPSRSHDLEQLAAEMLCPDNAWYGGLNYKLANALNDARLMVESHGGQLRSRQTVAAIIVAWKMAHPGEEPYIVE